MKIIAKIILVLLVLPAIGQNKLMDRNAQIKFESNAPVDDDVRAVNKQVAAILVEESGDLAFQVLIKGFEFKKALMQEHFNENYMESDKFPKARFKGGIADFSTLSLNSEPQNVDITGELEIKGKTKGISVSGTMAKSDDGYILDAKFPITITDFGIKIPELVADKVSKVFDVEVHAEFKK
ncbi:YceI family protein [Luteibaculum oceani]|uniref:YceI family protein n=1 Tax=Luteibaculum oceani TaxID=1294296 RepID=A0A5C6V838_9FLAO|nr:YceI family protein [Luteibaculum oceani]TXC81473.1 YceI family protein [Luteibaculum oceani]